MTSENPSKSSRLAGSEVVKTTELVSYQTAAIASRVILKHSTGTVTVLAFDESQRLSEHTAPFDALVQVLEGEVEITISDKSHRLQGDEMIVIPAGQPHALKALTPFKMILTKIRP